MERRTTALSAEQFLMNLRALKSKIRSPLPSDVLYYKCSTCSLKLPLNSAGIVEIESNLRKSVGDCIHQLLQNLVKIHSKTATCSGTLELDSVETPDNIIISFPASDTAYIEKFKIGNDPYKIMLMVQPESFVHSIKRRPLIQKHILNFLIATSSQYWMLPKLHLRMILKK